MKTKLSPQDRQTTILELLSKNGSVEVSELSSLFAVSEMSIRNDLNLLDKQGKLIRNHGGAHIGPTQYNERPLSEKQKINFKQKIAICKKATTLISSNISMVLDAGTTSEHIIDNLEGFSNLTVITNGVNIVNNLLQHPEIQVFAVGGKLDAKSYSILGDNAVQDLKQYRAQIGFITADGLSLDHGITNNSQEATKISKTIIDISMNKILLADSTKFNKLGVFPLCNWETIDTWVTDSNIDPAIVAAVEKIGVKVLISDPID